MAYGCAICGKQKNAVWRHSKLRGKYNPTVKQRQKPNLQWVRFPVGIRIPVGNPNGVPVGTPGRFRRIKACTKCIKALGKQ